MKIDSVSAISFKGKIIDAHAHIGNWGQASYNTESLDKFIKQPLENGDTIEKVIASNLSCIDSTNMKDEISGNLEMLNAAKTNPRVAPLAVCQPKTGAVSNIKKLFLDNPKGFIGLKFHPDGHRIMADDPKLTPYLKFASEHKLPCLFHCGIDRGNGGIEEETKHFSHPKKIYKAAQQIPNTPVILAHLGAGGEEVHPKAIEVLKDSLKTGKAKLYADISWVDINNPNKPTIVKLIEDLKDFPKDGKTVDYTDRLLFGSDAPIGEFDCGKDGLNGMQFYNKTVVDTKNAIKNKFGDEADEIIDKIFYKNAKELFFNSEKQTTRVAQKKISKTKIGMLAGAALLAGGAIIGYMKSKKQPKA